MAKTKKLVPSKRKKKKINESDLLINAAIEGILEKKGHQIVSLDLRKLGSSVADCFIVCHGESRTQVDAIAKSIEEIVFKKISESPMHKEGFENAEWIILDYFNVVIHIFVRESREFYGIEKLWADAKIIKVANR